jgi:1D-myo-inositol 3-kinase
LIDCLKIGAAELPCVNERELRAMLLYTEGARGCTIELPPNTFGSRTRIHAAPFPAIEKDATGAGDCFLAGFAFGLLRGLSPLRAARWGNYCGARAVESVGVPRLSADDLFPLLAE